MIASKAEAYLVSVKSGMAMVGKYSKTPSMTRSGSTSPKCWNNRDKFEHMPPLPILHFRPCLPLPRSRWHRNSNLQKSSRLWTLSLLVRPASLTLSSVTFPATRTTAWREFKTYRMSPCPKSTNVPIAVVSHGMPCF